MIPPAARPVRITSNGKIKTYVTFALDFFDNNENTPLVFHTLPPGYHQEMIKQVEQTQDKREPGQGQGHKPRQEQELEPQPTTTTTTTSSKYVTGTIPRLITVVEITKREYLKSLSLKRSTRLVGLHQYNEMGCLEDLPALPLSLRGAVGAVETVDDGMRAEAMDERGREVLQSLSGKNHLKKQRTPYMKITLSQDPIPPLEEQGATYQPPVTRKLSKSAKSRAKKRERKQKAAEGAETENKEEGNDSSDEDMSE